MFSGQDILDYTPKIVQGIPEYIMMIILGMSTLTFEFHSMKICFCSLWSSSCHSPFVKKQFKELKGALCRRACSFIMFQKLGIQIKPSLQKGLNSNNKTLSIGLDAQIFLFLKRVFSLQWHDGRPGGNQTDLLLWHSCQILVIPPPQLSPWRRQKGKILGFLIGFLVCILPTVCFI